MEAHVKTARAHTAIAVFYGFLALGAGVLTYFMLEHGTRTPRHDDWRMLLVPAFFLGLVVLHGLVARGARARREWARVSTILIGAVSIMGFPIGTLIGIYLLMNCTWSAAASVPATNGFAVEAPAAPNLGSSAAPDYFGAVLSAMQGVVKQNLEQQGAFTLFAMTFTPPRSVGVTNIPNPDAGAPLTLDPVTHPSIAAIDALWRDSYWSEAVRRMGAHLRSGPSVVAGLCSPARFSSPSTGGNWVEAAYLHVESRAGLAKQYVLGYVLTPDGLELRQLIEADAATCLFSEGQG